ncbi:hypothetical protein ACQPYK_22510 [Streptosporangium sp. CA-135522]|uniref:hypothetical protein n=1 Tax=Streptosporangium sp. CA-135522 TaxID=3240072 RepID=UPI003D91EF66
MLMLFHLLGEEGLDEILTGLGYEWNAAMVARDDERPVDRACEEHLPGELDQDQVGDDHPGQGEEEGERPAADGPVPGVNRSQAGASSVGCRWAPARKDPPAGRAYLSSTGVSWPSSEGLSALRVLIRET